MRLTPEQRALQALLAEPSTPAPLKAEASRKLGLSEPASEPSSDQYDPIHDSWIADHWNVRIMDENRNPAAERFYLAIVGGLILGGFPDSAAQDARLLLSLHWRTRHPELKSRAYYALRSIAKNCGGSLDAEILSRVAALSEPQPD